MSKSPFSIVEACFPGNMGDYFAACKAFRWEEAEKTFHWHSTASVNAAFEAIDSHLASWRKNKLALRWEGSKGDVEKFTFFDMANQSNRLANVLRKIGVGKGDRVFTFLPRLPELYLASIAITKLGAIVGPLFEAFGPEAVRDRLSDSDAKTLITTPVLLPRVEKVLDTLPNLRHIFLVQRGCSEEEFDDKVRHVRVLSMEEEMKSSRSGFQLEQLSLEDPWYLHYTSGTEGKPKGVVYSHRHMIGFYQIVKWQFDVRDDDIVWITTDPGWAVWTIYGWGVWLNGGTNVVYHGRFEVKKWYQNIESAGVNLCLVAPTALRMLMKAGEELAKQHDLSSLRYILSMGEPLNPEVIRWTSEVLGLPVHEAYGQTEMGACLISNFPSLPIKPGSMGKPFPGVEAAIIDSHGSRLSAGVEGLIALRPGWPTMMAAIWNDERRYSEYFRIPGWYLTGDVGFMDDDGYFWFVGRADDVIKTSGQRVGPFEVESALVEHPAVAEAAVVGKPDPIRGAIVKAFLVLRDGFKPSDELRTQIAQFVKENLSAHSVPRELDFVETLPKTRSGKIMRRVLRAREAGLPVGDLSALEEE